MSHSEYLGMGCCEDTEVLVDDDRYALLVTPRHHPLTALPANTLPLQLLETIVESLNLLKKKQIPSKALNISYLSFSCSMSNESP